MNSPGIIFRKDHQEAHDDQGKDDKTGVAKSTFNRFFQKDPRDSGRDRGEDDVYDQFFLKLLHPSPDKTPEKTGDNLNPIFPEVPEDRQQGAGMQGHVEGQAVYKRIIPVEDPGDKDE